MISLRKAARRAALVVASLVVGSPALVRAAAAQVWHANEGRSVYCRIPQTETVSGTPATGPANISTGVKIRFNIGIPYGVHERFGVEVVDAMSLHQMPAGTTTSAQMLAHYFTVHEDADFAFVYDANALMNDCDGDGVPALGAGNPPCWGAPTASLVSLNGPIAPEVRSSSPAPGGCSPVFKFDLTVNAPPLLNKGVVGIKVRGRNAGLALGMSVDAQEDPLSGHAWVHFYSNVTRVLDAYGKYPREVPQTPQDGVPFAPGSLRSDLGRRADATVWFPVTVAEWNAAKAIVDRERERPSPWTLGPGSCIHFAFEVLGAAGCPLPDGRVPPTMFLSPKKFKEECIRIVQEEQGLLSRCGTVGLGWDGSQLGSPTRTLDIGYLSEAVADDPQWLASRIGYEYVEATLDPAHLRPGAPLDLGIVRPDESLVFVDFGDGSTMRHGESDLAHQYGAPGDYTVRVVAIQNLRVSVRSASVTVSPKGPRSAGISCIIPEVDPLEFGAAPPPPPAVAWARTFPSDVNGDWIADGEDLAQVLAGWGSTNEHLADIDGDGTVGGNDLAIVLAGWGQTEP